MAPVDKDSCEETGGMFSDDTVRGEQYSPRR